MAYGHDPKLRVLARMTGACVALTLSALFGASSGCDNSAEPPPPTDPNMLRGIVRIYGIAANEMRRPPQSIDELKAVLAPVTDEPDKFLRSTRDGEEFAVVWGLRVEQSSPDTVLAHEKKGIDGKRMVVTVDGTVREVSAEEFAKLKFPNDYKPAI